mmetsp:Transcript_69623/g.220455  ORF Transcript_69623/g.220455 Transcript_69623/m.220455 type:complete len:202 (+) Transcript_69623:176-781(+)
MPPASCGACRRLRRRQLRAAKLRGRGGETFAPLSCISRDAFRQLCTPFHEVDLLCSGAKQKERGSSQKQNGGGGIRSLHFTHRSTRSTFCARGRRRRRGAAPRTRGRGPRRRRGGRPCSCHSRGNARRSGARMPWQPPRKARSTRGIARGRAVWTPSSGRSQWARAPWRSAPRGTPSTPPRRRRRAGRRGSGARRRGCRRP